MLYGSVLFCKALSVIFLFFSFEYTLIENSYLTLSSFKLKRLEEEDSINFELVKNLYEHPKLYHSIMFCDYVSNILASVSLSLFLYNLYDYIGFIVSSSTISYVNNHNWRNLAKINGYSKI